MSVNLYAQKCFSLIVWPPQLSHVTEDNLGSTLYSKIFLVSNLIGSFTLCFHFHFRCLCLIRTMNVYCKKSQRALICWCLSQCAIDFRHLLQKEGWVLTYKKDSLVLLLNMPDGNSFNRLLLISLPRIDRGWCSLPCIW